MIDKNILNFTNETIMSIDEEDKKIILCRAILSSFSFIFSLIVMIIYFIYFLRVKFKICQKTEEDILDTEDFNDTELNTEFKDTNEDFKDANENLKNKNNKIGLGSNYMIFLTSSNFFNSLIDIIFFIFYINKINDYKEHKPNQIFTNLIH